MCSDAGNNITIIAQLTAAATEREGSAAQCVYEMLYYYNIHYTYTREYYNMLRATRRMFTERLPLIPGQKKKQKKITYTRHAINKQTSLPNSFRTEKLSLFENNSSSSAAARHNVYIPTY